MKKYIIKDLISGVIYESIEHKKNVEIFNTLLFETYKKTSLYITIISTDEKQEIEINKKGV